MINEEEYSKHKKKCSDNFSDLNDKVDLLNRAMFGEEITKQKGVVDMTSEMYKAIMMAKSGEKMFIIIAKIFGASATVGGVLYTAFHFFDKNK